ncbi:uncharacterized protein LOC128646940 [Bombina bombina]|uniref:uncharacterized protein LOC128646940 n=1 Tax=Bombina bombina TaxID=8345 RepID=UPI00235B2644|nr:uncharacterized protein LOC128646940 [Bombina bombina]
MSDSEEDICVICSNAKVEPNRNLCTNCIDATLNKSQSVQCEQISPNSEGRVMPTNSPHAAVPASPAREVRDIMAPSTSGRPLQITLQDMATVMTEVLSKLPELRGKRDHSGVRTECADNARAMSDTASQLAEHEDGELHSVGDGSDPNRLDSDISNFKFKLENLRVLLGEVLAALNDCNTVAIPEKLCRLDKYFAVPASTEVFPIPKRLTEIVTKEWDRPGVPFSPPPIFRKMFPIDATTRDLWQTVPKVEGAVSTLAKRTTIPVEDSCAFSDPMDKKLEGYLKKMFVQQGFILQPLACIAPITAAAAFWIESLEENLSSSTLDDITDRLRVLKLANSFISEAVVHLTKLTAKNSGFAIQARRALWLKSWSADVTSKSKLLNIPFKGQSLFGPGLKEIIADITGGKGHALPQDKAKAKARQSNFRPFRNFKTGAASTSTAPKQEGAVARYRQGWKPNQAWNKSKQARKPAAAPKTA